MTTNPNTTAVLVLHMQNDIVAAHGKFAMMFAEPARNANVIPNIAALLEGARAAQLPVVYTRVCFRPGYPDLVVNGGLFGGTQAMGALIDGEPGADIVDELTPTASDIVVDTRRMSGFANSELDIVLKAHGIQTVLITGVATNVTVLNTTFDAINLGYKVTVVSDCCSTTNDATHSFALQTIEGVGAATTLAAALAEMPAPHD